MDEKNYYTPGELAALLDVTRRTVATWCREGKIECYRIGKLWRIQKRVAEPLIKAQRGEK